LASVYPDTELAVASSAPHADAAFTLDSLSSALVSRPGNWQGADVPTRRRPRHALGRAAPNLGLTSARRSLLGLLPLAVPARVAAARPCLPASA